MKKLFSLFALLLVTLAALLLVGCDETKDNGELLMLQTKYIGETVTDTRHVFKPEDFTVTAIYPYTSEEVTDFEVSVKELKDGFYTLLIEWGGMVEECYVPLEMSIYASEQ